MMSKIAIVEDDMLFRKELAGLVASLDWMEIVGVFDKGEDFLAQIDRIQPDILFLDIGLPGISGIQVANYVRRNFPYMEIVFITADENFMQDGFRLYATDYITKPLDTERLHKTLNRIKNKSSKLDTRIELKCSDSVRILNQGDICFVEAHRKNSIVYTHNSIFDCLQSISYLEAQLDKTMFLRTNRSFLVNLIWVESIKSFSRTTYQIHFKGLKACAYLQKKQYNEFRLRIKNLNKI